MSAFHRFFALALLCALSCWWTTRASGQCAAGEIAIDYSISNGSYPSEIAWQLRNEAGTTLFTGGAGESGTWCLAPGDYTFIGTDSFGDGWNGATALFYSSGTLIGSLAVQGGQGSIVITASADVLGCTDPAADNYNPAATVDDGSCCLDNIMTINLFDSFGDGWTWAGAFGGLILNGDSVEFSSGDQLTISGCFEEGCYTGQIVIPNYASEGSWTVTDANGTVINAGSGVGEIFFWAGSDACVVPGCNDAQACNYDPGSNLNDGSCEYLSCAGCTDPVACNYDSAATLDNGTCDYGCIGCSDPIALNFCADCTVADDTQCEYCEGIHYNFTIAATSEYGFYSVMLGDSVVASGGNSPNGESFLFCSVSPLTCVTVLMTPLGISEETPWTLTNIMTGEVILSGDGTEGTFATGTCTSGCNDPGACNYDGSNLNDGTCDYSCIGCTDSAAANYEPNATVDSGECVYCDPGTFILSVDMFDSYGDGWSGAQYFLYDNTSGDLVDSGSLGTAFTGDGLTFGTDFICLAPGCYIFETTNDESPPEVSISIEGQFGTNYGTVGANTSYGIDFTLTGQCGFFGCTDYENAANFNPSATYDDGSCQYEGCIVPVACNYNPEATIDDGSCEFYCPGCTDESACNFDPGAIQDDGSCDLPPLFYNCDGVCITDSDQDGVCDELEVVGCTDPTACNFNTLATDDDGTCTGIVDLCGVCGGDDSSCAGCIDANACNYDSTAVWQPSPNDQGSLSIWVGGGSWDSEISWQIYGLQSGLIAEGAAPYAANLWIPYDTYIIELQDAYGDGWNGAVMVLESQDTQIFTIDDGSFATFLYIPNFGDVCEYPSEEWLDCNGNCLGDSDGDGICDEFDTCFGEIDECGVCAGPGAIYECGCQDIPAGDCDCNGTSIDGCGVCGGDNSSCSGCPYEYACNYDPTATLPDASLCEFGTCPGCTNPNACNYNPTVIEDDGSCDFSCGWCSDPAACNFTPDGGELDTYCDYSCLGCNAVDALNYNPSASTNEECEYCDPGTFILTVEMFDNSGDGWTGTEYFLYDNASNDLLSSGSLGTAFVGNGFSYGFDRVCVAPGCYSFQTTPDAWPDDVSISLSDQFGQNYGTVGADEVYSIDFTFTGQCGFSGCTNNAANNYNPSVTIDDGSCVYGDLPGCTEPNACNFNADADFDDGSCQFPDPYYDCLGNCLNDSDGDGVCDELEVPGCLEPNACNFNPDATDQAECTFIQPEDCDCDGNQLDALGVCGGGCLADGDNDGVCDDVDPCVGTYDSCGVCNGPGAVLDCGCADIPAGDCDCDGNTLDALGVCGGNCSSDGDGDGVCDDVDPCVGAYDVCGMCNGPGAVYECGCEDIPAGDCDCTGNQLDALGVCGGLCNADLDADGICDEFDPCVGMFDECGVCNGPGASFDCGCADIPQGDCDCFGNQLDALDVCGGSCAEDGDGDGVCDDVDDCIGVIDECGVCNGLGAIYDCGCADIPDGDCDCFGNQMDLAGVCGGDCFDDDDMDGVCDDIETYGCTYPLAENYDPNAMDDDGSCLFPCEGVVNTNIFDWNEDGTITSIDLIMMLSVYGDTDVDFDGVWDSVDFCVDTNACNYDDDPSTSCAYLDALGLCGGGCAGDVDSDNLCDDVDDCVDPEACNFDALPTEPCLYIDALNVCGGMCNDDADGDGICDDVDGCVGVVDECGVCNGPGPTEVTIESITILYDSVFADQIQAWLVFEVGADTTFSYTCPPTIGAMPTSPQD